MGLSEGDLTALWVSLQLACITTVILLLLCTPLAWWLARSRWRGKAILESLIAMPLVLPPTVIGFYLLILLGSHGPFGGGLAFSFWGLVIGSVIYSLPFVVQPLQTAFTSVDDAILEMASTLRARPLDRFVSVVLPLTKHGFLSAAVLGFAHTLGEFGVVLMLGGNIAGETRVAAVAIYEHVERLDYAGAHTLSLVLLGMSFVLLLPVYLVKKRREV